MPAIDRNLLSRERLTPRIDRGPSHSPWVNVVSIPSDFMLLRMPLLQSRTRNPLNDQLCVYDCVHALITDEISLVKALFGEFEGSESGVGRTDEFRGPRDAGE